MSPYKVKEPWQMWLRILTWRDCPGLSEWALNAITGVVIRRTRELTHRKVEKDVKTESQRMEWCGHKQRNAGNHQKPEEARSKVQLCPHLEFSPEELILNFWSPELWKNKCLFFPDTKFVVICHYSKRKLMQIVFFWIHSFVNFKMGQWLSNC